MESEGGIPGAIYIRRPHRRWQDGFRAYRIFVDGRAVGSVRQLEAVRFSLPSGEHEVRASIDWLRSNTLRVHVHKNEEIRLEVDSTAPTWQSIFFPFFMTVL